MGCEVEYTPVFGLWWDSLDEEEQISVDAVPIADALFDDHLDSLLREGTDRG